MKKWHFKKWFQHIIEFSTGSSLIMLLGICEIDWSNKWSLPLIILLLINTIGGCRLLSKYGRLD